MPLRSAKRWCHWPRLVAFFQPRVGLAAPRAETAFARVPRRADAADRARRRPPRTRQPGAEVSVQFDRGSFAPRPAANDRSAKRSNGRVAIRQSRAAALPCAADQVIRVPGSIVRCLRSGPASMPRPPARARSWHQSGPPRRPRCHAIGPTRLADRRWRVRYFELRSFQSRRCACNGQNRSHSRSTHRIRSFRPRRRQLPVGAKNGQ